MIRVNNLSKKIQDRAVLENIDFTVKDSEILGLVGPNGAGKTTLLNIIAGVWSADSGEVVVDQSNISREQEEIKQKIGYIPDVPFLYPKLTGREFLSFAGTLYKLEDQKINQKITELGMALELSVWLEELMEGYPRGIKQKMTIAATLLHSPGVLLLDEPLTNLDPKSSRLVKDLLQSLAKGGASILLATHILEIAEKLCHRIVVINRGRKIAEGTIEELRGLLRTSTTANLEEIFLQLTGGEKYSELLRYLT